VAHPVRLSRCPRGSSLSEYPHCASKFIRAPVATGILIRNPRAHIPLSLVATYRRARLVAPEGYESISAFNDALASYVREHPSLTTEPVNNATRYGKHTGNLLIDPSGLVLFPSYFYHQTIPFESPQQRICIAFDAVPRF
jgi:hypothetical protein